MQNKVLIVDGDTRSLRLLEVSLKQVGYRVVTATSGVDALSQLEVEVPDLVLADTAIGEVDGFALYQRLQQRPEWEHLPFIFILDGDNPTEKLRAVQLGASDFLTRPVFLKEALSRVELLLEKHAQRGDGGLGAALSSGRARFAGSLSGTALLDLLGTMELGHKSGIAYCVSGRGQRAVLYFSDGAVVDAELGRLQGQEALYRVLTFQGGEYRVELLTVVRPARIALGPPALLMEAMRHVEEWNRLCATLPPLTAALLPAPLGAPGALRPESLPSELRQVLQGFDGQRSVLEVLDLLDEEAEPPHDSLLRLAAVAKLYAARLLTLLGRPISGEPRAPVLTPLAMPRLTPPAARLTPPRLTPPPLPRLTPPPLPRLTPPPFLAGRASALASLGRPTPVALPRAVVHAPLQPPAEHQSSVVTAKLAVPPASQPERPAELTSSDEYPTPLPRPFPAAGRPTPVELQPGRPSGDDRAAARPTPPPLPPARPTPPTDPEAESASPGDETSSPGHNLARLAQRLAATRQPLPFTPPPLPNFTPAVVAASAAPPASPMSLTMSTASATTSASGKQAASPAAAMSWSGSAPELEAISIPDFELMIEHSAPRWGQLAEDSGSGSANDRARKLDQTLPGPLRPQHWSAAADSSAAVHLSLPRRHAAESASASLPPIEIEVPSGRRSLPAPLAGQRWGKAVTWGAAGIALFSLGVGLYWVRQELDRGLTLSRPESAVAPAPPPSSPAGSEKLAPTAALSPPAIATPTVPAAPSSQAPTPSAGPPPPPAPPAAVAAMLPGATAPAAATASAPAPVAATPGAPTPSAPALVAANPSAPAPTGANPSAPAPTGVNPSSPASAAVIPRSSIVAAVTPSPPALVAVRPFASPTTGPEPAAALPPMDHEFSDLLAKARAFERRGALLKARQAALAAQRRQPRSADVFALLAQIALDEGNADKAAALGKRALLFDPRCADAYLVLGTVEQARAHGAKARVYFKKYLTLAPTGDRVHDVRAVLRLGGR